MIGGHRGGAVPEGCLQVHQEAIAGFLQRLKPHPSAGQNNCLRKIMGAPQCGDRLVTEPDAFATEFVSLLKDPVRKSARQEISPVFVNSSLRVDQELRLVTGRCRGQGGVPLSAEDTHIHPTGW